MRKLSVSWYSTPVNVPGVPYNKYNTELAFQVYCADWLRKRFQATKNQAFSHWHHSANERSNAREGFNAKMSGQISGFPDFINLQLGIAIELKVEGGRLSKAQEGFHNYLRSINWDVYTVYTFEEFRNIVNLHIESIPKK